MARAVPGATDNLASLAYLNEDVLLNELKARYRKDEIYVRSLQKLAASYTSIILQACMQLSYS